MRKRRPYEVFPDEIDGLTGSPEEAMEILSRISAAVAAGHSPLGPIQPVNAFTQNSTSPPAFTTTITIATLTPVLVPRNPKTYVEHHYPNTTKHNIPGC